MGQINVNRQKVLDAIDQLNEAVTTAQVSAYLSTPEKIIPERSVRAAFTWLVVAGYLKKTEYSVTRKDTYGIYYPVVIYRRTKKNDPVAQRVHRSKQSRHLIQSDASTKAGVLLQDIMFRMGSRV